MIRMRRRSQPVEATRHLDDTTMALLLSGEPVEQPAAVAGHLAHCAACRRRMETADPLLALFAADDEAVLPRPVAIPMPQPARLVPRPRWEFSAGIAMAAVAAVTALAIHHPQPAESSMAHAAGDVARITAAIRTAATSHDEKALQHALFEAKAELERVDAAHPPDPELAAQLSSLRSVLASLPADPATRSLVDGVEAMLPPLPSPGASSGDDDAQPAPADSPGEQPTDPSSPESTPTPEPTPDPTTTPAPDPTPSPDATPLPSPDATPSPSPDAIPQP